MKTAILTLALASLALTGRASPEAELAAKLPEIIAKSAAHYRALEAAARPKRLAEREYDKYGFRGRALIPHGIRRTPGGALEYDMRGIFEWTSGHFPGSLWYLYEATGDDGFREMALDWTKLLEPVKGYWANHDTGFMMYCSYGNARRLLRTDAFDAILRETSDSLAKRYDERLGLIRSWGRLDDRASFLVIPDNLMNLEMLLATAEFSGCARYAQIAVSHADRSMANHFRPDGGCYHVLDYDQSPEFPGRVKSIRRGQGLSCVTAWSRGQSWGVYGYTTLYRFTRDAKYLAFARKLADYAIGHPNMPADGVPYWDYGAPGEERDSSAAAVMASALLELSQYADGADGARYRAFAVKQLASLSSAAYFSQGDEIGHFLLKHGVGNKPAGSEIDTPLDYGDYYFLEALVRFRKLAAADRQELHNNRRTEK